MIAGNLWSEFELSVSEFEKLQLGKILNFEEFNRITIVHHSSAIEGSTLTLEESTLLITEGITSKGKPMREHQMVADHYQALLFTLKCADEKTEITPGFLKQINALVNKNTGVLRETAFGKCDDAKGDFRLGNVTAGGSYFVNYDKVMQMVESLCRQLQQKNSSALTLKEIYELSFEAHFNLVSIHPWFDGNGRTSRLLMNFIQAYHHQPLSIVFVEDKPEYFKALTDARSENNISIFHNFMCVQHIKYLNTEIEKFKKSGSGFTFLF